MTAIFMVIFGAGINLLASVGAVYAFSKNSHGDASVERKQHNLAEEKFRKKKDKWNEDIMKRLDFTNQRLRQINETKAFIKPVDKAIFEYYRVFSKRIKFLSPEFQLSDFYHPSEG